MSGSHCRGWHAQLLQSRERPAVSTCAPARRRNSEAASWWAAALPRFVVTVNPAVSGWLTRYVVISDMWGFWARLVERIVRGACAVGRLLC